MIHWAEPGWFILMVLVPLPWLFERTRPRVAWPTVNGFSAKHSLRAAALRSLPLLLKGLALACMVVALARPQTVGGQTRIAGKGVAIVVALDNSSSMSAVDFPSGKTVTARLEAARETVSRFVAGRPDDLLGLVVFANYPDPACPPTLDHAFLQETVRTIRPARTGDDGTNLGDAMALALDALHVAPPQKKVLVLLTDGRNSPAVPHPLDPRLAARLARDLGVTVHTIAIGQPDGIARTREPITDLQIVSQVEAPDFDLLKDLARIGGGRAFVAADSQTLEQVFKTIDALEKSPVQSTIRTRYHEHFGPWVAAGLLLLSADLFLSTGRLRRLP